MGSSGGTRSETPSPQAAVRVEDLDPLIVDASADVDRTLLRWMLSLSHRDRLRASTKATGALSRIRRGSP